MNKVNIEEFRSKPTRFEENDVIKDGNNSLWKCVAIGKRWAIFETVMPVGVPHYAEDIKLLKLCNLKDYNINPLDSNFTYSFEINSGKNVQDDFFLKIENVDINQVLNETI